MGTYHGHAVEEVVDEPERAAKHALNLGHVEVDVVAVGLAQEERYAGIVFLEEVDVTAEYAQASLHGGVVHEGVCDVSMGASPSD